MRSIGHISRLQRIADDDRDFVSPGEMLRELMDDNKMLTNAMRMMLLMSIALLRPQSCRRTERTRPKTASGFGWRRAAQRRTDQVRAEALVP